MRETESPTTDIRNAIAENTALSRKLKQIWSNYTDDENVAIVLESTRKYLTEVNSTSDIRDYDVPLFSIVSKIFPKLLASEIVSIQPIKTPTSVVFYYDPLRTDSATGSTYYGVYSGHYDNALYDGSKGLATWESGATSAISFSETVVLPYSGDHEGLTSLEVWAEYPGVNIVTTAITSDFAVETSGVVSYLSQTQAAATRAFDNNLSRFWGTNEGGGPSWLQFEYTAGTAKAVGRIGLVVDTAIAAFGPLDWNFSGSNDTGDSSAWVFITAVTSEPSWAGGDSRTYDLPTSAVTPYQWYRWTVTAGYSVLHYLTEMYLYELEGSITISPAVLAQVPYVIDPQSWSQNLFSNNQVAVKLPTTAITSAYTTYKSYATLEAQSAMSQVKFQITGSQVEANTRKLAAKWSTEAAQNFEAEFLSPLDDSLADIMATEVAAEIDREILRDLLRIAPFRDQWIYDRTGTTDGTSGELIKQSASTFSFGTSPYTGTVTQHEWNQEFLHHINKIAAQIKKSTFLDANWIVCSTEIGAVIETLDEFYANDIVLYSDCMEYRGKLYGRYKVYVDPYFPKSKCLIGHKSGNVDAGYIFAPYVPVMLSDEVLNKDSFEHSRMLMSRNAKKIIDNRRYGIVDVVFPDWYDSINEV